MSLKDCIVRDINNVFMRTTDFCDNLVIQVGNIRWLAIGSLQSNSIQNNSGNGRPLQEDSWTLYVKYPMSIPDVLYEEPLPNQPRNRYISNVPYETGLSKVPMNPTRNDKKILSVGTRLTVNDKSFTVTSISNEMGICTIQLSDAKGR